MPRRKCTWQCEGRNLQTDRHRMPRLLRHRSWQPHDSATYSLYDAQRRCQIYGHDRMGTLPVTSSSLLHACICSARSLHGATNTLHTSSHPMMPTTAARSRTPWQRDNDAHGGAQRHQAIAYTQERLILFSCFRVTLVPPRSSKLRHTLRANGGGSATGRSSTSMSTPVHT